MTGTAVVDLQVAATCSEHPVDWVLNTQYNAQYNTQYLLGVSPLHAVLSSTGFPGAVFS